MPEGGNREVWAKTIALNKRENCLAVLLLEVNYSFCDPQQNCLVRECNTSPTKGQKMGKIFVKIKDRHVIIHDTRGGDMVWLNDQRQPSSSVSDRRQAKQWSATPHHITFCWQTRLAWGYSNPPSNAPHYQHRSNIASSMLSMKLHWRAPSSHAAMLRICNKLTQHRNMMALYYMTVMS